MSNILIIGNGLLGSEIYKQTRWDMISRDGNKFDFDNIDSYKNYIDEYDQILNCVAYTKTYSDQKEKHWNTNYKAVCDLVDYCSEKNKKLIHISTDYIYTYSKVGATEEDVPVHCKTWYGYTKLLGDAYVQLRSNKYLLIRTSFKPRPFPYDKAIVTQIGNFDYVDNIAHFIIKLIEENASGIYNVGTEVKTIYDLAKRTNNNVEISYEKINENMPENVVMNINKYWNKL